MELVEKVLLLQKVDVFRRNTSSDLGNLAAIAEEHDFAPDTEVFHEGDPADALYVVVRGKVKLQREGEEVGIVQANAAFGLFALFEPAPRVASARVIEDTTLLRIDREAFYDLLAYHIEIVQGILLGLAEQIRRLVERERTLPEY